jgi:hypothetical protein
MSTQVVVGYAKTAASSVSLKATITDGSDSQELTTNDTYTITSQSLGTFMDGQSLTHLSVSAATGIAYCGVLRNGQFVAVADSMGSYSLGGQCDPLPLLPGPIRLQAGDQVIVRTEA